MILEVYYNMIKILFVCLGNICRSPMAEGLMKKYIHEEGLNHLIHVESRATSRYEIGNPPHPKTEAILKRENALLFGKYAQQINYQDFEIFDYIIGMDLENVATLKHIAKQHVKKVYLLRDIDELTKGEEVPDPYYSGYYEQTYQLISQSLKQWIDYLKKTL